MDDAQVFYGPPSVQEQQGGIKSLIGTTPPEKPFTPPKIEETGEKSDAAVMYQQGGDAGDPLEDYAPVTDPLFNGIDYDARFNQDEALLKELQESRPQVNELLADFQVGQGAAKEVMTAVSQYRSNPLSDEGYDQTWEATLHGLKDTYGNDAARMLAGAERVIAEIERRIPAARAYMVNGLNVDAKFINRCISIAKQKGYIR